MVESPVPEPIVEIKIWSDIMCPFCYIGKRHLEKAVQHLRFQDYIRIEWKSFQLDPDLEVSGSPHIYQYLADRKGIRYAQSVAMHQQVAAMAAEVGLNYDFDKLVVANSFQAHRLIQLAKTVDLGDEAEEILFKAYFEQGVDLGQISELIRLAQLIGIDRSLAVEAFVKASDRSTQRKEDPLSQRVLADIAQANKNHIQAVPYFLVDQQFGISGAQPVEVFQEALGQAFAQKRDQAIIAVDKKSHGRQKDEDVGHQDPFCSPGADC